MARRGDNRSPSPTGSSRRNARRDDVRPRDRRDEGRLSYQRSRSPADRARYRDRDSHRDHYGRHDRRESDYRPARRDRSRDRYRSPRSPDRLSTRDRRDRSRERGPPRDRRDDSRDRHRRRADNTPPSKRPSVSRDEPVRPPSSAGRGSPKQSAAGKQSEEDKKAERLARMQAWKEKQRLKELEREPAGAARKILDDMDRPPPTLSDTASPRSPATPATPQEPASPAPYAGKFDPKAIAKRAAANASGNSGALGDDLPLPKKLKSSSGPISNLSNGSSLPAPPVSTAGPLQGKAHVSGFGLGAKAAADNAASKRNLDFEEEEGTRKKLERLPTPPPDEAQTGDEVSAAVEDQDPIEDHDNDDTGSENGEADDGGAAAAARAAAEERRDERLRAEDQARQEAGGDATMVDATPENDEEEVDPLDAFMSGLTDSGTAKTAPGLSTAATGTGKLQAPEAYFSDDEDELTAIKGGSGDVLEMAALKAAAARRKKDIPKVDHSKMEYEPFQKSFYHEPSELADMTDEEVADLRLELDGIKVRGIDVPKPVRSWAQCGLGVASLDVIRKLGYEAPTSIQCQALPVIMSGRDVIGVAKTGSGKTMAFLLPMFRHIKAQRPSEGLDGPIGLIIAPTRELATQIHKDCRPWLKALNLRAVCAYGGAPIKEQIAELKRGTEIVVATAGRLIDLLAANGGRVTNLRRVTYVVLDEADRMFDMGFEPQIMKIMGNIRPERQTVLFSATFPRNMEALARKTLQRPVEIIVGGRSVVAPEITQIVEVRPENSKFLRLLQLLGEVHEDEDARSLIFVDRQESAEDLMNAILKRGYPCFTIHGGKDQFDRDTVIADFKAGIFPVMVATSVAARGLDVKQLKMVVNFDCPNHLEDYVHRAGRTGRAGQKGLAVTFITEEQGRFSLDIAKALRQSGQEVPEALQKLGDEFLEKVKAGKEKQFTGTGFGGKGLDRLEADRDAARLRERGLYKTGDEPDENDEKTKEAKDKKDDIVVHSLKDAKPAAVESPKPVAPKPPVSGAPVIDLDAKINVIKKEAAEPTANRMATVSEKVAAINARLRKNGDIRGNAPIDNKGPDAGEYHATLEINDFPQKARWACTNRTNVAKILAETGTSITTKGEFYAPGRPPPGPTDPPKLYILVEGDTEISVINAMKELQRSLHDAMAAVIESEARAPVSGRYSVV